MDLKQKRNYNITKTKNVMLNRSKYFMETLIFEKKYPKGQIVFSYILKVSQQTILIDASFTNIQSIKQKKD